MLSILTSPVVKMYIGNALNEEYQIWLSSQFLNHPEGFPKFMLSDEGVKAFQDFIVAYRKALKPRVALLSKTEPETTAA